MTKFLVPSNKSQFLLYDDPDFDNWKIYIMNRENVTTYDDKLVSRNSGEVSTFRGGVLEMITEYKFETTGSLDAKLIVDFRVETHFYIRAQIKHLRDRNLMKNIFNRRAIFASGLKRSETFLSENPSKICDRLCLITHEKQTGKDTISFEKEYVSIID